MGLAASQARFLAITARKMNCEFQSMQVAQEKLSVTRDLQRAANDYQTALDATKLIWDTGDTDIYDLSYGIMMTPSVLNDYDPYLITDTKGKILLTDQMFNAAVAAGIIDENGDPIVYRDENQRLIGPRMVGADNTEAGITAGVNDGSRNAFLYQLGKLNQIDGATVDAILNLGNEGYTKSGIGGPIFDKTSANALSTNVFIDYLKTATYGNTGTMNTVQAMKKGTTSQYDVLYANDYTGSDGVLHTAGSVKINKGATLSEDTNVKIISYAAGDTIDRNLTYRLSANTTAQNDGKIGNTTYTAGQTITGGTLQFSTGDKTPIAFSVAIETTEAQHKKDDPLFAINIVDILNPGNSTGTDYIVNTKQLSDGAGDQFSITKGGQALSANNLEKVTLGDIVSGKYQITFKQGAKGDYKEAFTTVLKAMAEKLGLNAPNTGLNIDSESDSALQQAYEFTKMQLNLDKLTKIDSNDIAQLYNKAQEQNNVIQSENGQYYSLSLTNILKSFLTNFAVALEGFDCGYVVNNTSAKESDYVTSDLDYYFILKNDGAMTDRTMLNADFYNMIYNQISTTGACSDSTKRELVMDNGYLQQALKNGQLFISSLNTDGYFYQGPYTQNGHVAEVQDEDAIARAEVEYNVKKSKLNYKEETLELQLKNLDMEISSLTTEFDTVKNLISKNVEKVFTMFST